MKNKKTYLTPTLEECVVCVESGIATSVIPDFMLMNTNSILDMEDGGDWGAYIE